jgi:hypothetical protein
MIPSYRPFSLFRELIILLAYSSLCLGVGLVVGWYTAVAWHQPVALLACG